MKKTSIAFLAGVIFGIFPGVMIYFWGFQNFLDSLILGMQRALLFSAVLLLLAVGLYMFRENISRYIFGKVRNKPERIATELLRAVRPEKANETTTDSNLEAALEELASWLLWVFSFRSLIAILLGLFATFAAGLGSFLLLRQNEILANQGAAFVEQSRFLEEQATRSLVLEAIDAHQSDRGEAIVKARIGMIFASDNDSSTSSTNVGLVLSDLEYCLNLKANWLSGNARVLAEAGIALDWLPGEAFNVNDFRTIDAYREVIPDQIVNAFWEGGGFEGVDFENKEIVRSSFAEGWFHTSEFSKSSITETCFASAALPEVEFNNVQMLRTIFSDARMTSNRFQDVRSEATVFSGANLGSSSFESSEMRSIDFSGADLSDVSFKSIAFSGTMNFVRTDLSRTTFEQIELQNVRTVNKNNDVVEVFSVRDLISAGCASADGHPTVDGTTVELPNCE